MNKFYAKSILYSYSVLNNLIDQIDELALKKALSSMNDYSPAENQCVAVVNLVFQKQAILKLKDIIKALIKKLSQKEYDLLDYKYFKLKPKEYYKDFDFKSRNYFRNQQKLCKKITALFEQWGMTDTWYEENYLTINFFNELLKRVKEQEELSIKYTGKVGKQLRQKVA